MRVLAKADEIGDAKILRKPRKLRKGLEDLRKMTIFAPDEIGVFEADFSQESNWRQTRKSFANFWS